MGAQPNGAWKRFHDSCKLFESLQYSEDPLNSTNLVIQILETEKLKYRACEYQKMKGQALESQR